jgi:hypothetical protein
VVYDVEADFVTTVFKPEGGALFFQRPNLDKGPAVSPSAKSAPL